MNGEALYNPKGFKRARASPSASLPLYKPRPYGCVFTAGYDVFHTGIHTDSDAPEARVDLTCASLTPVAWQSGRTLCLPAWAVRL